ncbi:PorP/SprF family type IX secretion system membrane protein [Chitinophaga sancti]|uniref:Type IX secretion system membrane protein PorP/SprF n=1 Tax=Chitinophaga sancti TaxID=1004 RepID=A0A1K1PR80_9BACT|nr:type IX secretion system membrane protein PorP/SprF [Chitinophaga sancti]WQD61733.1 type IX secretion system membrane protein PorP/SprF [Chitinophaga sancti]WQG92709.1 type IX secretion system membrane protein PorP/SprF [Chitinophaga sancti]SFW50175.1 type IX secretion system membrane protein, PorP/SprF family [Chitinophaga sancti]
MKKVIITLFVLLAYYLPSKAQQDPIYSQYMFNGLAINPAYASLDESARLTVDGRNQWVGVDGAPKTATFSFYSPLNEKGTTLGFSAMRESITVDTRTDFNIFASQKVELTEELHLAMGLIVGMSQYKENNSTLTTTDPSFASNLSYMKTNVGFGFALFTERFYLGLGAPMFKSFDIGKSVNRIVTKPHYYMQAAYVFDINDDLKFKPTLLLRDVKGSGLSYDFNASILLKELVWLGASWRSEKTVTGMVGVRITPQLEMGYSYDTPTNSNLKGAQSVSHELMISYRFGWSSDHEVLPRLF